MGLAALAAACDTPQFRVGGTVTGLSGNLTLQLNGQESLTRDADGPFSFNTQLEDESTYTVTVATAPAEQDCTVVDGTGKVSGADVNSVRVGCTQRTYTIGGTVEGLRGTLALGLDGGEGLQVTQNGRFIFATRRPKGGAYTVGVTTQPAGQRCSVSSGSGTVAGNVEGILVQCRDWFELVSTQAAEVVIGQQDFVSASDHGGSPGKATLNGPWGNPAFAGGRLYVSDQSSNRVLGYPGIPTANGAEADTVLGQAGFTSATVGSGQSGLGKPEGLSSDGSRLAVTDFRNSRILLYTPLPTGTGATPALVVGQPGLDSTASKCDQTSLSFPEDVFLGHGKLLVADSTNNRVLVWNTLPTTNGAPADLVLGQSTFTTCVENDADGNGVKDSTPGASTLSNPTGVWTDGTRLVVVDSNNHRVLIWNQFPTRNAQPADVVLGQTGFTTGSPALGATRMNMPYTVTSTGLQLFVTDNQNHRVLVWNQFPIASGTAADLVLGQPGFTSANPYDPPTGDAPSKFSLNAPSGVLLAWPHVVVSDGGNNRVLVFKSR